MSTEHFVIVSTNKYRQQFKSFIEFNIFTSKWCSAIP